MAQRIDHDVADQENAFAGAAFLEKMLHTVFFGDEKIVGDGVGKDAVDLFGHGTVKTAEARLDVGDANAKLQGGKRNGDRGVDVATTRTRSGLRSIRTGSMRFKISAVCAAWEPEPTSRFTWGAGIPIWRKKMSESFSS